jgi:hypothetical protein
MASRMAERVSELGERARARRTESRLDRMDRENDRLKQEVHLLREDLQEERSALQQALDALRRDEHVTVETKGPKRRGRFLGAIVLGGIAYVLGAKAGRERYDQITGKARAWKSKVDERMNEGMGEDIDRPTWNASNAATSEGAVPGVSQSGASQAGVPQRTTSTTGTTGETSTKRSTS